MTTTAYDTHFIASDIAFTDADDCVHLDIPFRKVKRIGESVIGMAGCLYCMNDFSNMLINFIRGLSAFNLPVEIMQREQSDFIAMIYISGACWKITKMKMQIEPTMENITQIPTVIGSGSYYVQNVIDDCPNAVVAVLEARKCDKYTDGEVKYCSIKRNDIHNLEENPMNTQLNIQLLGIEKEISATNDFLMKPENKGKAFHAGSHVHHVGKPSPVDFDAGMKFLEQGFSKIRDSISA